MGAVSHAVGSSDIGCETVVTGAAERGRRELDRGAGPRRRGDRRVSVVFECKSFWLACAEGDDAPDRVVWGNPDGDAVTRHDLDAESPHAATELSEHLVSGVALHAVET